MFFITIQNQHIQPGGALADTYATMREKGFNTLEERPGGMTVIMREADKSTYCVYNKEDGQSFEDMAKINLARGGNISDSIYTYLFANSAQLFNAIIALGGNVYGLPMYHKRVLADKTLAMPTGVPGVDYEDENGNTLQKTWGEYHFSSSSEGTKEDDTYFYIPLAYNGHGFFDGSVVFTLTGGSNLLTRQEFIDAVPEE